MYLDASGPLPVDRDTLGRHVHEVWQRWARTQPDLVVQGQVEFDEQSERQKEVDRLIGESVARYTLLALAARNGSPVNDNG